MNPQWQIDVHDRVATLDSVDNRAPGRDSIQDPAFSLGEPIVLTPEVFLGRSNPSGVPLNRIQSVQGNFRTARKPFREP
jgi:hypothetical protein